MNMQRSGSSGNQRIYAETHQRHRAVRQSGEAEKYPGQGTGRKIKCKKLEDYFQEVLPKLQSNFFISLIEGRVGEEDYERFLQNYRVDMKGPLFCCIIFHTSENDVPDGMNLLLLSMSVEREVKQRLTENCNCQEFIYMGNTILIMELHSEEEMAQLTDSCDRFCRWAWRIMGAAVTAGIGTVCNSLHDISISYEGAREAVSYRVLYGTKRAINIAEIVPKEPKKTVPLEETRMQDLFRAIHVGDQEEIRKEAIKEIEKLHKNADTISQYNLATMEIVSGFSSFVPIILWILMISPEMYKTFTKESPS